MQGGWGDPCVPAHEPYFYLVCQHRRYPNPANISQTPRTHGKPHSEPAPARARVVDLSCRIDWGVAFRSMGYIQSQPNQPAKTPRDYRRLSPINITGNKKPPRRLGQGGQGWSGFIGRIATTPAPMVRKVTQGYDKSSCICPLDGCQGGESARCNRSF